MALTRCPWMLEYRRQRHHRLFLHPQPISPLRPMHPGSQLSSLVLERANYCPLQVRNIWSTLLQYRRYNAARRGLGDFPQFLRVSSLPRPPKLPRTIDRCEFFFGSHLLLTARHSTANKVQPPTVSSYQMRLYPSSVDTGAAFGMSVAQSQQSILQNGTPVSAHGGNGTPAQTNSTEEVPDRS